MSEKITLQKKTGGFAYVEKGAGKDDWLIAGYASTFGPPPDLVGDIIESGAYEVSLLENPVVPVLWSHDTQEPIGKTIFMTEDEHGLVFKARITSTRRGSDVQKLVKDGVLDAMSIGYQVRDSRHETLDDKTVRYISDIDLMEISVVTFPANPRARMSGDGKQLAEDLQRIKDAVRIAEHKYRTRNNLYISDRDRLKYIEAEKRGIDADLMGGSRREIIRDISYELAEMGRLNTRDFRSPNQLQRKIERASNIQTDRSAGLGPRDDDDQRIEHRKMSQSTAQPRGMAAAPDEEDYWTGPV